MSLVKDHRFSANGAVIAAAASARADSLREELGEFGEARDAAAAALDKAISFAFDYAAVADLRDSQFSPFRGVGIDHEEPNIATIRVDAHVVRDFEVADKRWRDRRAEIKVLESAAARYGNFGDQVFDLDYADVTLFGLDSPNTLA